MNRKTLVFIISALLAMALGGCNGEESPTATAVTEATAVPTPTLSPEDNEPARGQATVESIQIQLLESFPVQVNVLARGMLRDSCTLVDSVITQRNEDTFQVVITTLRQPDPAGCDSAPIPFEENIPLDVLGLDAGTYNVVVNGITGSFTLDMDNRLDAEGEETTGDAAAPTAASISGTVWHDLCAVTGGEGDAEAQPSEGCVATDEGSFAANGELDADEPGIADVVVDLGAGECPAAGLDSTATDGDGRYTFTDLEPGTYCVSIDTLSETNSEILVPGGWTFPLSQESLTTLTLGDGENMEGVDFGWDYEFLPIPEVDPTTCTNSIEFVQDMNVPDDTAFEPGIEFTKTWRLRNNGTCPWTTAYSLVPVGGDEIPAPESVPLATAVAPGQNVDLSVTFTAPEAIGTYRSNWQIANAAGEPFGIDGNIGDAFWVQIEVSENVEPTAEPEPNSAVIGGVIWEDICRVNANGNPGIGCIETSDGSGEYRADGTLNFGEPGLSGITVQLSEGACPADGFVPDDTIIEKTITDEDGLYRFEGLDGAVYCVSIAVFDEENVDLLLPGNFTYPAPGVGLIGVSLAAAEERLNVDFGWDYLD